LVKDRRGRLVLPIVSMMDILSGAAPLIVDVRQTGSGPQGFAINRLAGIPYPWWRPRPA
jgi:hypothetical protein